MQRGRKFRKMEVNKMKTTIVGSRLRRARAQKRITRKMLDIFPFADSRMQNNVIKLTSNCPILFLGIRLHRFLLKRMHLMHNLRNQTMPTMNLLFYPVERRSLYTTIPGFLQNLQVRWDRATPNVNLTPQRTSLLWRKSTKSLRMVKAHMCRNHCLKAEQTSTGRPYQANPS